MLYISCNYSRYMSCISLSQQLHNSMFIYMSSERRNQFIEKFISGYRQLLDARSETLPLSISLASWTVYKVHLPNLPHLLVPSWLTDPVALVRPSSSFHHTHSSQNLFLATPSTSVESFHIIQFNSHDWIDQIRRSLTHTIFQVQDSIVRRSRHLRFVNRRILRLARNCV